MASTDRGSPPPPHTETHQHQCHGIELPPHARIVVLPDQSIQPTVGAMKRQRSVHHRLRRRAALTLLSFAAIVAATARASPVTSRSQPLGACTLRPTADSTPFEVEVLDTFRVRDGVAEILHDARCSDGRSFTVWIPATVT